MSDPVEPLVLDLLEWIGRVPRPYAEVIEVWKTSCPRLPVWEEANIRGFVERRHQGGDAACIQVSAAGWAFLNAHRGAPLDTGTHVQSHAGERPASPPRAAVSRPTRKVDRVAGVGRGGKIPEAR